MKRVHRLVLSGLMRSVLVAGITVLKHQPSMGNWIAQRTVVLGEIFRLPPISLKTVQNNAIANQVQDDRGIRIGGLFSGLDHSLNDPDNIFYAIADRGPNDRITVGNEKRGTFPVGENGFRGLKAHLAPQYREE